MNDNLAPLDENDQQPMPSLLTGKGRQDQDIIPQQQQTNNNNASDGATSSAAPPRKATSTKKVTRHNYYAPPPPLDGDDTDDLHHQEVVTTERLVVSSSSQQQESSPAAVAAQLFGSTTAAAAEEATTVVADYIDSVVEASAAAAAPFSNIPVDYYDNNSDGIIISQPSIMMDLHGEQRDVIQQQQQQHQNERSSPHHHPVMEGAIVPSQIEHTQQHQIMPYNEITDESKSRNKQEAHHAFTSSSTAAAVPEESEHNHQQDLRQYHPPPLPPNLPPLTLPSPPPPLPLDSNQYPQDSHHHPYHHYSLHQQQSQLHPIHMNDTNHVHHHQQQRPPLPPPIAHHSPPYPDHHQNQQHPHYYQQQYQHDQQYPSYNHHQQPNPSNHHQRLVGFNTDRPTYLFALPTTDSQSLSDRQCYIRSTFIELFLATANDVASRPAKGSQKIHEGQIGIRCAYCVDNNTNAKQKLLQELQQHPPRVERAVCFPQSISRIYQTVADMQRRHFEKCARIPVQIMGTYKSLKSTRPRGRGNPQEYWESSAREIGLVDSPQKGLGIRVMKDGEGRMVEQFLRQRKKVEENENGGVGGGGVVLERCRNESAATAAPAAAAQVGGGDYIKKPSAKRGRSVDKEDLTASRKKSQTDVDQDKTSSVIVNKIIEPPPPVSSYSDAHLLASMRDGASPSLPVVNIAGMTKNDCDESQDVHPQK